MRAHSVVVPVVLLIGAVGLASLAPAQPVLKREPPMGKLKPGERRLVDDGTCPKGQIKLVIGGDHIEAGGRALVRRTRTCIARR